IMIGGGRKRVLSLAAREADVVSIANVPFTSVNDAGLTPQQEALRRLGYVQAAAGDRFSQLDIESSPFFTEVTDDTQTAVERVASMMGVAAAGLGDHPNVLVGSPDEIVDRLQERRQAYGVNYVSIQQSQVDSFAPVAARLTGT
nr:hypothetical protein [Micromonospora sp. DSM 115978]